MHLRKTASTEGKPNLARVAVFLSEGDMHFLSGPSKCFRWVLSNTCNTTSIAITFRSTRAHVMSVPVRVDRCRFNLSTLSECRIQFDGLRTKHPCKPFVIFSVSRPSVISVMSVMLPGFRRLLIGGLSRTVTHDPPLFYVHTTAR